MMGAPYGASMNGEGMRSSRRAAVGAAAAIRLTAALAAGSMTAACAGCSLRDLRPAPPTAVQPVFSSDEEASAAAATAYERYLGVTAEIDADGGAGAERVLELTTDRYGLDLLADYRRMRASGERLTGAAALLSSALTDIDRDRTRVSLAVCLDLSAMRFVDESGAEMPFHGEDLVQLEVSFRSANPSRILLDGATRWEGEPIC